MVQQSPTDEELYHQILDIFFQGFAVSRIGNCVLMCFYKGTIEGCITIYLGNNPTNVHMSYNTMDEPGEYSDVWMSTVDLSDMNEVLTKLKNAIIISDNQAQLKQLMDQM